MPSRRPCLSICAFLLLATLSVACRGGGSSGGGGGDPQVQPLALQMAAGGLIRQAESETWPEDSEVTLDEDLEVRGKLVIEPGTKVTVADGVGIVVTGDGMLELRGSVRDRITFTTDPGDRWDGIVVDPGATLIIEHSLLEKFIGFAVLAVGGDVTISDSLVRDVIRGGDGDAVGLSFTGGEVTVTDTTVSEVRAGDGAAGARGLSGSNGAAGSDGTAGDPGTLPTDGDPGQGGVSGLDGDDGGSATGIFIGPGTEATLAGNRIEEVEAGDGGNGGTGGNGGDGGPGGNSAELQAGANGGLGGDGGNGGAGGDGGAARGLWLEQASSVALLDQRILDVIGGDSGSGADGADAGAGGAGGNGGDQAVDPELPGAGGNGSAGGESGAGGAGGAGGPAWGVFAEETETKGLVQHLIANVIAGSSKAGGRSGNGGDGGHGGDGGDSVTAGINGAMGGNAGDGGASSDGAEGSDGGDAIAVEIAGAPSTELATLNTLADLQSGDGSRGADAGAAGVAGDPGAGGAGFVPIGDGQPGSGGSEGATGSDGNGGKDGVAVGALASDLTDLEVRNNVFDLASPLDGIGLLADRSTIDSNFNFFNGIDDVFEGAVSSGSRDREMDPQLIDPDEGDYRLGPDSPAIDAGNNAFLPGFVDEDLDGEPRPVDDPATPDTGDGQPPIVDVGAFEFQPPSCETDPGVLWPPNHKYVDAEVDVDLGTTSALDPDVRVWAASDEPDNDIGDGNTTGDVNGSDGFRSPVDVTDEFEDTDKRHFDGEIKLRSERQGPGDGREYTVTVELTGEFRPRSTECSVRVPHDQGGNP